MKKMNVIPVALLLGLAFMAFTSCEKEDPNDPSGPQTLFGPTVSLGNGTAGTYVVQDENGDPMTVGVVLTADALENLPEAMQNFVLQLPENAGSDFYTHVLLDWNPQGHEPPGIYDLPHFDLHFYIISNEDRMNIGPEDLAKFANAPDAEYVPTDYFMIEGGVPQMGAHWLDGTAPELSGSVFTKTFIWGSFDGEFIFWEPMITREYLLTHPDEEVTVKQPAGYEKAGWYPTKYKVAFSSMGDDYMIALDGLTYHEATPVP